MKKVILIIFIILLGSQSKAQIKEIIGTSLDCNGCVSYPLNAMVLCTAPSFCVRIMAPDWTDQNRFYGTDGTNCKKSIDGGVTWNNCVSNPSPTTTYLNYAVTKNGTVLATANDSGNLRVRRSVDGAITWNTVYNNALVDSSGAESKNRFRCAQTIDLCMFVYRDFSNNARYLISTDDGQTWTNNVIGTISYISLYLSFENDGSLGIVIPPNSDGVTNRALLWNGSSWTVSSIWPTTSGGLCNWSYIMNSEQFGICHVGGTGTSYEIRNSNGIVLKTFTLPDVPSDNGGSFVGLSLSLVPNWIAMLRLDTISKTGLWISIDNGTSFTKLTAFDVAGQGMGIQGSIFKGVNGCMYASWLTAGGSTSTVIRVC